MGLFSLNSCKLFNYMILLLDYGVTSYDIGDGFGHFGIATQDVRQEYSNFT